MGINLTHLSRIYFLVRSLQIRVNLFQGELSIASQVKPCNENLLNPSKPNILSCPLLLEFRVKLFQGSKTGRT